MTLDLTARAQFFTIDPPPRLDLLRAILVKLDPQSLGPQPLPPLRAGMGPRRGRGRRQRLP